MTQFKNKPIISIFIHCFPPARGGLEYLTGEIKKILDSKYEVHIITGQGLNLDSYKTFSNFTQDNSNNVHRLELKYFWQRIANKFLNKIIFKIGFFSPYYFGPILKYSPEVIKIIKKSDLIIGAGMPTKMFYDSYFYAKKYNKKLICLPAYHNVNYFNRCIFFQLAFDYASKIIFLTPFEATDLKKNYRIDIKKLFQTTFCPYTKEEIVIQESKLKKNKRNKRSTKHLTIGFIGQITLRKNLIVFKQYLDKYLSYWQNRGIDLSVHLAGAKTNSSNQIEVLFKTYIDQKIVSIRYNFDNKEKEFSKIDIFINPSVEESLGIVNFEALYYYCNLIIPRKSAFASLSSGIDKYDSIETMHKLMLANAFKSPKNNKLLLTKYSFDNFRESVFNVII